MIQGYSPSSSKLNSTAISTILWFLDDWAAKAEENGGGPDDGGGGETSDKSSTTSESDDSPSVEQPVAKPKKRQAKIERPPIDRKKDHLNIVFIGHVGEFNRT